MRAGRRPGLLDLDAVASRPFSATSAAGENQGVSGSPSPRFELIGGVEKRAIGVVPHNFDWAFAFQEIWARVSAVLAETAFRIDHIGSTSVPGLAAKPIIDIDLSVREPDDESAYLPQLERAGFHLRVREPGRRMVRTSDRGVHVHVCRVGGDWERRHLLFRDWLLCNEADRKMYGRAKLDLARQEWADMNAYAEAKSDVIGQITKRAEEWAQTTGWQVSASTPAKRG